MSRPRWRCYVIEPTNLAALTLRRYQSVEGAPCPLTGSYHNAEHTLADVLPWPPPPRYRDAGQHLHDYDDISGTSCVDYDPDDPLWSRKCKCGFWFAEGQGNYQPNYQRLFGGTRDGAKITGVFGCVGPTLPPGAMFYSGPGSGWPLRNWQLEGAIEQGHARPGPDGKYLTVMLPAAHWWVIDGNAWNAEGSKPCPWTRTGTPPDVVAGPSINIVGSYHGWLGQGGCPPGWLSDDLDGHKFDDLGKVIR